MNRSALVSVHYIEDEYREKEYEYMISIPSLFKEELSKIRIDFDNRFKKIKKKACAGR